MYVIFTKLLPNIVVFVLNFLLMQVLFFSESVKYAATACGTACISSYKERNPT